VIKIIVAMDRKRAIGKDGKIPWHLPEDLRRFRKLTLGHAVIMGRRTFESIGRPLQGRRNIVVTRRPGYVPPGCTVVHRLDDAFSRDPRLDDFVIGGAEIYAQSLPRARVAFVTEVDTVIAGADAFFPEFSPEWSCAEEEARDADAENPLPRRYLRLERG